MKTLTGLTVTALFAATCATAAFAQADVASANARASVMADAPVGAHVNAGGNSAIKLYVLDCGRIEMDNGMLFSDSFDYDGKPLKLVDSCYVIKHPQGVLVWDTGLSDGLVGKAEPVKMQYTQQNDKVIEFIDDIPAEFAKADIVICRAGALTVAEVAATESCAIFVPLPIAVDDHQTYNARSLSDNDAAIIIQQDKLAEDLYSHLDALLSNPHKIKETGRKAKALCIQNATLKVASAIVQEGLRDTL